MVVFSPILRDRVAMLLCTYRGFSSTVCLYNYMYTYPVVYTVQVVITYMPPPGVCGLHHVCNVHVHCLSLTFYLRSATIQKQVNLLQTLCVRLITGTLDGFLFSVVVVTTSYAM